MRLSEAVALARSVKTRVHGALTTLHRESQKEQLYLGRTRVFRPKTDEDDTLPPESERVRLNARDVLDELRRLLAERWNSEGLVVINNAATSADVVLSDGTVLLRDVPPTYLIFLEKALEDLYTFVAKLPVLDPAESWEWDDGAGLYRGAPVETTSEKREWRALVLHPATEHFPAQTEKYEHLGVRGYWRTTKLSGALPVDLKRATLMRVVDLRDAVKTARERANHVEITRWAPADALLAYVLDGDRPAPKSTPR